MSTLYFTIPGEVRGKGRPRLSTRGGFARMHTDTKTASYEGLVALAAQTALAGAAPLCGPLQVDVVARLVPAASLSSRKREALLNGRWAPKKPDLDNVVKAVLDGCNGVAFADDVTVCRTVTEKVYAATAGVDVTITPLSETPA